MHPVVEQMSFYEAYHKHPLNKLTHFIGIPAIVFSIFIPLSWPAIALDGATITLGMLVLAAALAYYFYLDRAFGAAMTVILIPLLYAAHYVAQQSWTVGIATFLACFVGGWIVQIVGHVVFEKRRPALMDNLFQLVIGPVFLCAEVFFMLGFKEEIHQDVVRLSARFALEQPAPADGEGQASA